MSDVTNILLVSAGPVHPSWLARYRLGRVLRAAPGFRFRRLPSLESLPTHSMTQFQAIVLYFHHKNISPQALSALDKFVQDGGGLLAVHSASASFKQEDAYFEILGGRFSHHGPIQPILVEPAARSSAIFGDISTFSVTDELYRHECEAENQVHFYALIEGQHEPIVWTRQYGQGRVCYCSLGHQAGALNHPALRQILQRGLAWAGRRQQS